MKNRIVWWMLNASMLVTLAIVLTVCPYTVALVGIPATVLSTTTGMSIVVSVIIFGLAEALTGLVIGHYLVRRYAR